MMLRREEKASDLWIAAKDGDSDTIARIFRDVEATINIAENGATPLWIASKHGHDSVVRLLVDSADVDWANDDGETALYTAAQEGHAHIVETLIRHANVNMANEDGATPLYIASEMGHVDVIERLLQHGMTDSNLANRNGASPLHIASERGHVRAVTLLLPRSNAAHRDMDGWTALHAAAYSGQATVVELLVASGAFDVAAETNGGDTALDLATEEGHTSIVHVLRQYPLENSSPPTLPWPCLWLVEPAAGYNVYPKKLLPTKQMRLRCVCPAPIGATEITQQFVAADSATMLSAIPLLRISLQFLTAAAMLAEHPGNVTAPSHQFCVAVLESSPSVAPGLDQAVAAMSSLHSNSFVPSEIEQRLEQLVTLLHGDVDVGHAASQLHQLWTAYELDAATIAAHKELLQAASN